MILIGRISYEDSVLQHRICDERKGWHRREQVFYEDRVIRDRIRRHSSLTVTIVVRQEKDGPADRGARKQVYHIDRFR